MLSVPYLSAEVLIAAMNVIDARQKMRPLFQFFQKELYDGERLEIRTERRAAGIAPAVGVDGRAIPVRRSDLVVQLVKPLAHRFIDKLTTADLTLFRDADQVQKVKGMDPLDPIISRANRRILSLLSALTDDGLESEHRLMEQALQGEIAYRIDGADVTVNYNLTALTQVGTSWANAAAKVIEDIHAAIEEFQTNSLGHPPTHVFYNPKVYANYLAKNTQWTTYVKQVPALSRGFVGSTGGTGDQAGDPLVDYASGAFRDAYFGMIWVPIRGVRLDYDGASADRWPVSKLVLASLGTDANSVLEWSMLNDEHQNGSRDWVSEVFRDNEPKATQIRAAHNGAAVIKVRERVQPLTIAFP